jgi:hypothetical protein
MVRRGFGAEVDLEKVWDENEERACTAKLQLPSCIKLLTASREIPRQKCRQTSRNIRKRPAAGTLRKLHTHHDRWLRPQRAPTFLP